MILAECPECKTRQARKHKKCIRCGKDLDQSKKSQKVRYWIQYRLPDGKQCKEFVGNLVTEAEAADGKRKGQKKDGEFFKPTKEAKMTFQQITDWFLPKEYNKVLAGKNSEEYHQTKKTNLESFNKVFGNRRISSITIPDLREYQGIRKQAGMSDSYIDQELRMAGLVINTAFEGEMVSRKIVKRYQTINSKDNRLLRNKNDNARKRILKPDEFERLISALPYHAKNLVATGYYTGMRRGEIFPLTWDKVDLKNRIITLDPEDTKDDERRLIPICDELYNILKDIPKAIHAPYVFLYKGKPVKDIRTALKKACKEVGIPYGRKFEDGITFHTLRHTFNTNMRKAGVADSVTMKITGHSTMEMFDRYNTVDEGDVEDARNILGNYLANVTLNVTKTSDKNKS